MYNLIYLHIKLNYVPTFFTPYLPRFELILSHSYNDSLVNVLFIECLVSAIMLHCKEFKTFIIYMLLKYIPGNNNPTNKKIYQLTVLIVLKLKSYMEFVLHTIFLNGAINISFIQLSYSIVYICIVFLITFLSPKIQIKHNKISVICQCGYIIFYQDKKSRTHHILPNRPVAILRCQFSKYLHYFWDYHLDTDRHVCV